MEASSFFSVIKETHEGWKAHCPMCGNNDWTLHWNTEKQVGTCHHSSCPWYTERGGVTFKRLAGFFRWKGGQQDHLPEVIQASPEADIQLPKEFQLIENLDSSLRENLLAYLELRGFHKKIVHRARLGYCSSGEFWGYLIAPVFDNGEVVYWQGRRFKNRNPKFWNPASSRKNDLLYRIGSSRRPRRIVLVESIFNAITLEAVSDNHHSDLILGLLGKSISAEQIDKILVYRRYVREIVIALDPDAINRTVEIAAQLSSVFPSVKIPLFPEGEDINSLGREKAWDIIYQAGTYNERTRMRFLNGDK